jgi:dipeptidyl aminopeptidase/acylaminoacyl peptidase
MWTALATAAATLLTAQSAAFVPPDCGRAVKAHTRNGDLVVKPDHKRGLWLASANGHLKRQLTSDKTDIQAKFSPDGRRIAFARVKKGRWSVMTLDLKSGHVRRVFPGGADEITDGPTWSPDGRWIAFLHSQDESQDFRTDITLVRPNGKGAHAVHRVSELTQFPTLAWSRNGRCVAYQWGDFDRGALAIQNHDFTAGVNLVPFRVTFPDGAEIFVPELVNFSADGKRLYVMYPVTVNGKSGDRIYAIPLDKPDPPILVAKDAGFPLESPDGRRLVYAGHDRWARIRKTSRTSGGRRFFHGLVMDWAVKR